jgi:hypothetical protein
VYFCTFGDYLIKHTSRMKKLSSILLVFLFVSCAELQQISEQFPQTGAINNFDISNGLKEALNNGISKQVTKLTATDGFFGNELVKIALPQELRKVDKTLRDIGLSSLADQGLRMLNRAAEDAVKEAVPVFVDAVKNMSFADAKNILMGADNSATNYLQTATSTALYTKFSPVVQSSLSKVGADKVWQEIITKYNQVPFVDKVNPNLVDYVTNQAMDGVFTMIALEEKDIRTQAGARTSDLLKKVFALQDRK